MEFRIAEKPSTYFESLAREAVAEAIARQKALGLPNYFTKNEKIYGRMPSGRIASLKDMPRISIK